MAKPKKQTEPENDGLLTLMDFSSTIGRLRISPEGTRLAVTNSEKRGEVLVVALPSGKTIAHYTDLGERPQMAFRSEKELLIAHGKDCIRCDLSRKKHQAVPLLENFEPNSSFYCCEVSPDGKTLLLGGWDLGGLLLVDLAKNGTRLLSGNDTLRSPFHGINCSPDGRLLALVVHPADGDREWCLISVIDSQTEKHVCDLKLPEIQCYVYISAIHPDNRILATGWRGNILLFDLVPPASPLDPEVLFGCSYTGAPMGWGRPIACYSIDGEHDSEVNGLWYSANGKVLKILRYGGEAVLMSAKDGRILQRMKPPAAEKYYGAVMSRCGRVAAAVGDKQVATWLVPWWSEA